MIRNLVVVFGILVLLGACDEKNQFTLPIPPAELMHPRQIAAGAELFAIHCAQCHGSIAEGRSPRAARFNPPAPDFHAAKCRKSLPGYLYRRIELGRTTEPYRSNGSVMPAWGVYLQTEQLWQLVAYLKKRAG